MKSGDVYVSLDTGVSRLVERVEDGVIHFRIADGRCAGRRFTMTEAEWQTFRNYYQLRSTGGAVAALSRYAPASAADRTTYDPRLNGRAGCPARRSTRGNTN